MTAWRPNRRAWGWLALTWSGVLLVAVVARSVPAAVPVGPLAVDAPATFTLAPGGVVMTPPVTVAPTAPPSSTAPTASMPPTTTEPPRTSTRTVPRPAAKPPVVAAPPAGPIGAQVVAYARLFYGVPYVWGGVTRAGMDCSGLTWTVLRHLGYTPPRTAAQQALWTVRVAAGKAQPGDLVFLGSPATHVGIYIGGGRMIDSSQPGTVITDRAVFSGAYYGRIPS